VNEPGLFVRGTGTQFDSVRARPELMEPARPGEHVWMVTAVYRVTPETIAALEAHEASLDAENLALVLTGCFVCEQPYAKRLTYRVCPGEPKA
jgi:hypothetical protein